MPTDGKIPLALPPSSTYIFYHHIYVLPAQAAEGRNEQFYLISARKAEVGTQKLSMETGKLTMLGNPSLSLNYSSGKGGGGICNT